MCFAYVLLLAHFVTAIRVVRPARVPVELGGRVIVAVEQNEPAFSKSKQSSAMCVIARIDGEGYTLNKPGYVVGKKGAGAGPFMKSYNFAGEEVNTTLVVVNSTHAYCDLPPVLTAGETSLFITMSGDGKDASLWEGSSFEYFAMLNPSFGRRPYIRETSASLVVATDRSLYGLNFTLTAAFPSSIDDSKEPFVVTATIAGGLASLIPFDISGLPTYIDAHILITLAGLPGKISNVSHSRRFIRAPPPPSGSATTTFQVDFERGGSLLADGVPYVATGWFAGGYPGEFAGYPLTVTMPTPSLYTSAMEQAGQDLCASHLQYWGDDRPIDTQTEAGRQAAGCFSDASNLDSTLSQISVASEWGRLGLNFVRSGVNNVNLTEGEAYLDAMAAMGQYALWQTPIDDAAMGTAFFNPETNKTQPANGCPPLSPLHPENRPCIGPGADPTQRCCYDKNESILWDYLKANFTWLAEHQAYAGAYGCDDCCHVMLSEKAWVEYQNIAKVKDMMRTLDPHHLIFGTIACDNLWMWGGDDPGAGLGLDVVMKENYGGGISAQYWDAFDESCTWCRKDGSNGAALQQGKMNTTGKGFRSGIRSAHHRVYPMTWSPIWNMPDASNFATPREAMAFAWRDVIISGESSTNWFVYNVGQSQSDTLVNQQIPYFQAKIQELLPSLQSRARFEPRYHNALPVATVTAADPAPEDPQALAGPAAVILRLYTEEVANAGEYCLHLVSLSTQARPQTVSYRLDNLPAQVKQGAVIRTLFEDDYTVPLAVSTNGPNISAGFRDVLNGFDTKVYRLGCMPVAADPANLVADPSFESMGPGWADGTGTRAATRRRWSVRCAAARNVSEYYPLCDPRLHVRSSTAAPRSGRHCLHVQIPSRSTVARLNFPAEWTTNATTSPTAYRAEIWARSSPAAVNATLRLGLQTGAVCSMSHSLLAAGEWTKLTVEFTNATAGSSPLLTDILLEPTVGVAATVWLDDASIKVVL